MVFYFTILPRVSSGGELLVAQFHLFFDRSLFEAVEYCVGVNNMQTVFGKAVIVRSPVDI